MGMRGKTKEIKNFKNKKNFILKTFQREKEESIKAAEKMHNILKKVSDACFSEVTSKINLK